MSDKAMYAQKTYSSTVHYLRNPQQPFGYGNFGTVCGTGIQGATAIKHIPHGVKVCKRCVKATMLQRVTPTQ